MVLNFLETLDYYDVPLVVVAEDFNKQKWLCNLYIFPSKKDSDLKYECVTIYESRLKDYKDGIISIDDIFNHQKVFKGISKDFADTIIINEK